MLLLNFLIKLKESIDFISNTELSIVSKLQPFFKKDILFFIDKDEEHTELIDAFSLFEKAIEKKLNAYYIILKKHPSYAKIKNKYGNRVIGYGKYLHIFHFFKFLRLSKVILSFGYRYDLGNFFYKNKFIDYIFINHGPTLLKKIFSNYTARMHLTKFLFLMNMKQKW